MKTVIFVFVFRQLSVATCITGADLLV